MIYKFILFLLFIPNISGLLPKINNYKSSSNKIPDLNKRHLMNQILLSSVYTSCGPLLLGYLNFFYPKQNSNNNDGLIAKDKYGNDVILNEWINNNPHPSRNLVQGLKGDPYYLISIDDSSIESYALNVVCTHLGCVVPWNKAENKFMCPCHGSQYNNEGKVIRGPAPKSLALSNVEINNNKVYLKEWTNTDFRTNESPWWIN